MGGVQRGAWYSVFGIRYSALSFGQEPYTRVGGCHRGCQTASLGDKGFKEEECGINVWREGA